MLVMPIIVNGSSLKIETIIALLQKNDVLNAIKWTREQTGIGLKGAHEIVSNLAKNPDYYDNIDYTIANNTVGNSKIESHSKKVLLNEIEVDGYTFDGSILFTLLENHQNLEAIKYVKEVSGLGLKEAKDIVERLSETTLVNQNIFAETIEKTNLPKEGEKLLKSFFGPDQVDSDGVFSNFKESDINKLKDFLAKKESKKTILDQNEIENQVQRQKGNHFIKERPTNFKKNIIIAAIIGLLMYAIFYLSKWIN